MIRHHPGMDDFGTFFADRADAGRQLASRLADLTLERPVVLALPRGGVPVAVEIAERLNAPLDLVMVRKLPAPGDPELALGALVEGSPPLIVINERMRGMAGVDAAYVAAARDLAVKEIERRRLRYLGDRSRLDPTGRAAIVVDDGLATGATMKAALLALRDQGAARIIVALPVAPASALPEIAGLCDEVICLHAAERFHGVGGFYRDFRQVSDAETIGLLARAWSHDNATEPDAPGL